METLIIAEAGVNHNGSPERALEMVRAAHAAGADVIKFQTFSADALVVPEALKADYQKVGDDARSQYDMLRRLELGHDDFYRIIDECNRLGIEFMSTPFSVNDAEFLAEAGMARWKIASGEITNLPLLEFIARQRKPVIMSTGMCSMQEVRDAVDVLTNNGLTLDKIYLLHCTTAYPAPFDSVNLKAMEWLRTIGTAGVGYSDHTPGTVVAVAAVAMGACIVEKHFTLDRNLPGPDHKASLTSAELASMVTDIRIVEKAMGTGRKGLTDIESANKDVARKSIVAARHIDAGEIFTADNVTAKRPGTGVSPMRWHDLVGKSAKTAYSPDQQIAAEEL